MEAPVCLREEGIDDNNSGVGIVIQAKVISDHGRGVGTGRWIRDASEGSETMTEAAGARKRAQGIYNNNRGVGGGR